MQAMSPDPHNDDPTHALDDFVRRMRPAAAVPKDTDLADLQAELLVAPQALRHAARLDLRPWLQTP